MTLCMLDLDRLEFFQAGLQIQRALGPKKMGNIRMILRQNVNLALRTLYLEQILLVNSCTEMRLVQ